MITIIGIAAKEVTHTSIVESSLRQAWQRQRTHAAASANQQSQSSSSSQWRSQAYDSNNDNDGHTNSYSGGHSNNDGMNTLASILPPFLSAVPAASTQANKFTFLSRDTQHNAPHHTFTQVHATLYLS